MENEQKRRRQIKNEEEIDSRNKEGEKSKRDQSEK